MGALLEINGRVFEINNRENGIMKRWGKRKRTKPKPEQHEYVDLGLPSKTLWATENIKDKDGNELYFAWGETQGYTSGQVGTDKTDKYFAWEGDHADYEFGKYNTGDTNYNYGMTEYNNTDKKTVLDPEDDAATVNWGSSWRMPTKEQFDELKENTTTAFTEQNGVYGLLCTSTANTNTLFFPAVGNAADGDVYDVGAYGQYWSVSLLDLDDGFTAAWELYFFDEHYELLNGNRCFGFSVRPVRK